MTEYFIKDSDFGAFVSQMMGKMPVWGPVAKKTKFVFAELENAQDLRLDYTASILPPKKVFFPTTQPLVTFGPDGAKSCINPKDQVLMGVHPYDMKAIDMLDQLFCENHADHNYLANRNHTTIVLSNITQAPPRAFFASVGHGQAPKGHDAFLTKIDGGYHFETLTDKGEALKTFGKFGAASEAQTQGAKSVNEAVKAQCSETLEAKSEDIAKRAKERSGDKALWEEMSKLCFSCGLCNVVCPTCYCFDVQDTWNLDQVSGVRRRTWDACQLRDFAQVSLGAGATENFREGAADRYRHRYLRKASYLNDKLDGPACVGCGRCSISCPSDIADPVKITEKVMEA